jgi:hypothetical protein
MEMKVVLAVTEPFMTKDAMKQGEENDVTCY